MSKHTLGAWRVVGGRHGYEIQTQEPNDKGALTIVASQSTAYRSDVENDANAHLIAAAPDMYESIDPETLEAIADELTASGFEHSARAASLRTIARMQRAAIAKADGRKG